MNYKLPSKTRCAKNEDLLENIIPPAIKYSIRKRFPAHLAGDLRRSSRDWRNMPENYDAAVMMMLALGSLFLYPRRTASFQRAIQGSLSLEEEALVRHWIDNPWFYCLFKPLQILGNGLIEVEPQGLPPYGWPASKKWKNLVLFFPFGDLFLYTGKDLYFTLLWPLGGIYYTYGLNIPFTYLRTEDFYAFSDILIHRKECGKVKPPVLIGLSGRTMGLSDVMAFNPTPFYELIITQGGNLFKGLNGTLMACSSYIKLPPEDLKKLLNPEDLRKTLNTGNEAIEFIETYEGNTAVFFMGESALDSPRLYLSFTDKGAYLTANSEKEYSRGRRLSLSACIFPEEPQKKILSAMDSASKMILQYEDGLLKLERLFEDITAVRGTKGRVLRTVHGEYPKDKQMCSLNERLSRCYDKEITETDQELAEAYGFTLETVQILRRNFLEIRKHTDNEIPESKENRLGLTTERFCLLTDMKIPDIPGFFGLRNPLNIKSEARILGLDLDLLLSEAPVIKFCLWFLKKAVIEGHIPATSSGFVRKKILDEALEMSHFPDSSGLYKSNGFLPAKEVYWGDFYRTRLLLESSGLLRLEAGKFIPEGGLMEYLNNPERLFYRLICTMFTLGPWAPECSYPLFKLIPPRAGFLLYAMGLLSGESGSPVPVSLERFTQVFINSSTELMRLNKAGALDINEYSLRKRIQLKLDIVFIQKFAGYFGLAEKTAQGKTFYGHFRLSPLYYAVFFSPFLGNNSEKRLPPSRM